MINKNKETVGSLQIKLELSKKSRIMKKDGSVKPDINLPFEEFILDCYLNTYPCSYGKYIEEKIIHDIKKSKSYVKSLPAKENKGDFEVYHPISFTYENVWVYLYNEVVKKFSYEVKTTFLNKKDMYSIRNIKPYQDINGGYILCLIDCDNNFKEEIYVINSFDFVNSFKMTHMDGTADKHSEDGFKNLGLSFSKNSDVHTKLKHLSKMNGTSLSDLKEYINNITKKLHNDLLNCEQFINYEVEYEEFYHLEANYDELIDKTIEIQKNILNIEHFLKSVDDAMSELNHKYNRIKTTYYNGRAPRTMFFKITGLDNHKEYFKMFYYDYQDELLKQLKMNK
jgi:hypothetical protein